MSYRFTMFFTKCKKEQMFDHCIKIVERYIEHAEEYMKENAFFMPYNRYSLEGKSYERRFITACLYDLFNFQFVYWEKYELLGFNHFNGVMSEYIHDLCPKCIHFQNSTDQNYAYDIWSGIDMFEEIAEQSKTMSAKEIIEHSQGYYTASDEEEIAESIEYYRKAITYRMIYNHLYLDEWINGRPHESFYRFAINGIHSQERMFDLLKLLPPKDEF